MDNGHNQVNGFNQEVFQGDPAANPFAVNPDLRATGNKILNFNPENTPDVTESVEVVPQIGGEMPQMGQIVDVSAAPENIPGMITSYNIRTDKDKGLNDDGVRAINETKEKFYKSGDTNEFYAEIRGFNVENLKSMGKDIGKAA